MLNKPIVLGPDGTIPQPVVEKTLFQRWVFFPSTGMYWLTVFFKVLVGVFGGVYSSRWRWWWGVDPDY